MQYAPVRKLVAVAALVLVFPAAATALVVDEGSRGRGPGEVAVDGLARRGVTVYCGSRASRLVALTFDDGPSPYSRAIAGELRRAHARATFFLVGERLAYWHGALRAEASVGAIGVHTWTHASLATLDGRGLRDEVGRTRTVEIEHTGRRIDLFRPPYGVRTHPGDEYLRRLGLLQVLWDVVDSRFGIRPGSIVLLHETHAQTLPLLRVILRDLRRRGLRAVTVPELLANAPPPLERDSRGLRTAC
jgi:peptidoglycan/xylan/chitin deacetylase (PgdA/CDA1 family)